MKPTTTTEIAGAIEYCRLGAYPSREQAAVNEAWRELWRRLQPITRPQLHLVHCSSDKAKPQCERLVTTSP